MSATFYSIAIECAPGYTGLVDATSNNCIGTWSVAVVMSTQYLMKSDSNRGLGMTVLHCTRTAACLTGTYKSDIGPGQCLACPGNSMTQSSGAASALACVCPPGFTGPNSGPRVPCLAVSYNPNYGADTCMPCPVHAAVPAAALPGVNLEDCQCLEGFTSTGYGCNECANNHYGPSCLPCTACVHGNCSSGIAGSCACILRWAGDTCEVCASGLSGATCELCVETYHYLDPLHGTCRPCPNAALSVVLTLIAVIALVLIVLFLTGDGPSIEFANMCRTTVNFATIIFVIVAKMPIEWPMWMVDLYRNVISFFLLNFNLIVPECLVPIPYNVQWNLVASMPAFVLILVVVAALIGRYFLGRDEQPLHVTIRANFLVFMSMFTAAYLTAVSEPIRAAADAAAVAASPLGAGLISLAQTALNVYIATAVLMLFVVAVLPYLLVIPGFEVSSIIYDIYFRDADYRDKNLNQPSFSVDWAILGLFISVHGAELFEGLAQVAASNGAAGCYCCDFPHRLRHRRYFRWHRRLLRHGARV